jgi:hypothetical protein
MWRVLVVLTLLLSSLYSEGNSSSETNTTKESEEKSYEKNVYIEYSYIPERIYKGQVFKTTLKTTVVSGNYRELYYKFYHSKGLKMLSVAPERQIVEEDGLFVAYDTIYYKVTGSSAITPKVYVYLKSTEKKGAEISLHGERIDVTELPETENFSQIFASELEIFRVKSDQYDQENNIVTLFLRGEYSDLNQCHFQESFIKKQGFESRGALRNFAEDTIVYYLVIPKYLTSFQFRYFNTTEGRFITDEIGIQVSDDMVTTTKTDLTPKDIDTNRKIKIGGVAVIVTILLILFYINRSYWILFIASGFVTYGVILTFPKPEVCVKEGSIVRILPMLSSTHFSILKVQEDYEKLNQKGGFVKIRLKNSSEGWIQVEDICKD